MSALSDWGEAEVAKYLFTAEANDVRPTAWYAALHTADPTDVGGANEVVAGWYTRKSIAFTRTGSSLTNTALVSWNAVTGSAVTITHVTIKDALSGGNTIAILPITTRSFNVGDVCDIQASALVLTVA